MALEGPVRSSTGSLQYPFGHFNDMSMQSESDRGKSPFKHLSSPAPPTGTDFLRPNSANRIPSHPTNSMLSPSDIVGPSPVTSNGTETTEIEDDVSEDVFSPQTSEASSFSRSEQPLALTTDLPDEVRQSNEESVSVIHAPESFTSWTSTEAPKDTEERQISPRLHHASLAALNGTPEPDRPPRPPISTDVKPVRYSLDSATPRAHNIQNMIDEGTRLRSSSTSSLEKIEEQTEAESDDDHDETDDNFPLLNPQPKGQDTTSMLKDKLRHYWDTCAFLAKHPPTNHNFNVLTRSGTPSAYGRAWEACWKLCQRLYANQNKGGTDAINLMETLTLIRQFSQALFDVRVRVAGDEESDSYLRALYEAQNHLWNGQAPSNPVQFHERSLDFYIAMCHRSMRLREGQTGDTEALIATCWSLAELLFSLRQCRREGGHDETELLEAACQACWDLCGLFQRNGSNVQTERNTPRPSQTSFGTPPQVDQSGRESRTSNRSSRHSRRDNASSRSLQEERARQPPPVPETPVTDLEDTPISPGSRSPTMPNIMVLGPSSDRGGRWSSTASNMSSYSHSSNRTSSTATTTTATEDPNVTRAKMLILRAAMNTGFKRENMTDSKNGSANLQRYVKAMAKGEFGVSAASDTLLQQYKDAVLKDCFVPRSQFLPSRPKKYTALEMARVVQTLATTSSRYSYLRDLYKFVFMFSLEDGLTEAKKLIIEI